MLSKNRFGVVLLTSTLWTFGSGYCLASNPSSSALKTSVDAIIQPLMQSQDVPGMAVAVLVDGKAHYFSYGVASKADKQPVTPNTLFEIGSVSKTFTATLAGYAVAQDALSLSNNANHYVPQLHGSAFDNISVLNLGTYTAGGLPLQFPNEADAADKMMGYYQQWQPRFAPAEQRLYSNPSLGLFGYAAAKSLGQPFDDLMEKTLFPKLGLKSSYIEVPQDQMSRYAQGYTKDNNLARVGPGAMASQAYGVKTTAEDLLHFVRLNLQPQALEPALKKAIDLTQTSYYQAGQLTQGLGWELYTYPVALNTLLSGNSSQMALEPHKANWFETPRPPQANSLINKTGSTNGFGAYVVYIPAKQIGIVLLANKNYPIPSRVKAAYELLSVLDTDR
ncbi:class C beta-lactamase [Pseudomonas sp. M30-35]|uniref:class C beta-lactamase n=1 Tax=Pseudomonas sp. M30-35 TaxID=1981174 RepID=UPI000B3C7F6A|nr:class C beta-lactamase [Pseudomonas sp. M30-35]ARU88940.1 class C beta-lactamase [Pseudomonas sp. M30-35]